MTLVDIAVLLESEADKMPDRHFTVVDGVVTETAAAEQQDSEQPKPLPTDPTKP